MENLYKHQQHIYFGVAVQFEFEKRFDDCRDKNPLPFDFFIPGYNLLIEYDGMQHFISVKSWGGEEALLETQRRDNIKNLWAKEKGIQLLRIHYTEKKRIKEILTAHILEGQLEETQATE